MKTLYKFTDKLGDKEYAFALKKPSRSEMEEIEIFSAAILSKMMNMGVQTRAAVDKYYADNTDGAMSNDDEKEVIKLKKELIEKEEKLITTSGDDDISKDKKVSLMLEIHEITEKIRNYNQLYSAIYENTAEVKARNKTIDFCFLNFSCIDEQPAFSCDEEDFTKRMVEQFEIYDSKRDEDEFWADNFDKMIFLFTLWYLNAAETEEEFDGYFQAHFGKEIEEIEETPEEEE